MFLLLWSKASDIKASDTSRTLTHRLANALRQTVVVFECVTCFYFCFYIITCAAVTVTVVRNRKICMDRAKNQSDCRIGYRAHTLRRVALGARMSCDMPLFLEILQITDTITTSTTVATDSTSDTWLTLLDFSLIYDLPNLPALGLCCSAREGHRWKFLVFWWPVTSCHCHRVICHLRPGK